MKINFFLTHVSSLLDVIIFSTIIFLLFNKKVNLKKIIIQFCIFLILIVLENMILGYQSARPSINFTFFILFLTTTCFVYKMNLKLSVLSIVCYSTLAMLSETLAMASLNFFYGIKKYNMISNFLVVEGGILTYILKIFFCFCIIIVYKRKIIGLKRIPSSTIIHLVIISFLSIIWFILTLIIGSDNFEILLLNSAGILSFNLLIYTMTIFLVKVSNDSIRIKVANTALKADLSNVKNINTNLAELRRIRHDLKNTLLVINGHLNTGNISRAMRFIEEYQKKISKDIRIFSSNPLINYFLSEKYHYAIDNGIETNFNIKISENISISEEVISIILANLLDNSIEACLRMKSGKRKIDLKLIEKHSKLFIEISNSFNSKEDKIKRIHGQGIGLKNIKRLVDEKNGIYQNEIIENIYKTIIILFV